MHCWIDGPPAPLRFSKLILTSHRPALRVGNSAASAGIAPARTRKAAASISRMQSSCVWQREFVMAVLTHSRSITLSGATASPPPLVGEGWGGGSGGCGKAVPHSTTPTPNPSPQGGGEEFAAPPPHKLTPMGG